MNNVLYGKAMENLGNIIDVKRINNKKYYLKWTSKPSYMSHIKFDNYSVAIRRSKVTLTLNKPAYVGLGKLDLSKVLMCEFPYDPTKNKYGNNPEILFTSTDIFMCEIKSKNVYNDFNMIKQVLILAIIQISQNIMMIQTN